MSSRRYRLLCPIARALDHVGDRWALLILRDLHAGPVRHKELAAGLTGVSSNLLATRLAELQTSGLVEKFVGEHDVPLYRLTSRGEETAPLLFALAEFGAGFEPEPEPRAPGNGRLAVVTLRGALARAVGADDALHVELRLDEQPLAIDVADGAASVRYAAAEAPDAVVRTSYRALIDVVDGVSTVEAFVAGSVSWTGSDAAATGLLGLLQRGFSLAG